MKIEIIEPNFPHLSWFYLHDVFLLGIDLYLIFFVSFLFFHPQIFQFSYPCHCALHCYKGLRGVAICV